MYMHRHYIFTQAYIFKCTRIYMYMMWNEEPRLPDCAKKRDAKMTSARSCGSGLLWVAGIVHSLPCSMASWALHRF